MIDLDALALADAMGNRLTVGEYERLLPGMVNAMLAANVTNANRAAMWCAQIGHESGGLRWMEEIADGSAYEWRADLGNTQAGDGRRFKGSGPIQLTGRHNFTLFSKWAAQNGHTNDPMLFVNRPELVRTDPKWGFLAAAWYWVAARPQLNALSDARDMRGATIAINGGLNGLQDRETRYAWCIRMGDRIVPKKANRGVLDMNKDELRALIYECLETYVGPIGSDVKDVRQQLTGARNDHEGYPGFVQGGKRTLYDVACATAEKVGVPNTKDVMGDRDA